MCFVLSFFGQRIIEPLDSSLVKHVIAELLSCQLDRGMWRRRLMKENANPV